MDTIVAIATPRGRGGIGVIRVSGPAVLEVMATMIQKTLVPRVATHGPFLNALGEVLDEGLCIYFKKPYSFTGEDILEFQGHGGPIVLDRILHSLLKIPGLRLARPGEFSEQAFLNHKMDLAQAEAVADLIDAQSEQAAKCALRSLQGDFSKVIHALVEGLIHLRKYVEASIDFPEEEIDFLADEKIRLQMETLQKKVHTILGQAQQGRALQEGIQVVIAGKPNAGKSSLLNALAGQARAIVTDIAGTTRDILRETIILDGLPVHLLDTAGLRESHDVVEQEGIRRAREAMGQADLILLIVDHSDPTPLATLKQLCLQGIPPAIPVTVLFNKIDVTHTPPDCKEFLDETHLFISVTQGLGVDTLKQHLKKKAGLESSTEGLFLARRRHLDALHRAQHHLDTGARYLRPPIQGELLAEELRLSQEALSEITGEFRADDLLGEIFSSFCIGK
jgi:tRNA modification GTPase